MYDYLIVGAGLFGATFARIMTDAGKSCLVIDERDHIGGNCFSHNMSGIEVHKYGPHIFHTNSDMVWKFVNRFCEFNTFTYRPKSMYNGKIYSFPINLLTMHQLWGVTTPEEAVEKVNSLKIPDDNQNIKGWVLSNFGKEIYDKFVYHYTLKQWGRDPELLPSSIIKRIPFRYTFNDRYFSAKYEGIPINGYTSMIQNILDGIEVRLGVEYLAGRKNLDRLAHRVVYTGPIDKFFDYSLGRLEWRSLSFDFTEYQTKDYQGVAAINYNDSTPYTRSVEYKHFTGVKTSSTIVSRETSDSFGSPSYPIRDEKNLKLLAQYRSMIDNKFIFGGRLAEFMYYDMDQTIASAITICRLGMTKSSTLF